MINLLDGKTNQPTNFRTRNSIEINDESPGTHTAGSDIWIETSMI